MSLVSTCLYWLSVHQRLRFKTQSLIFKPTRTLLLCLPQPSDCLATSARHDSCICRSSLPVTGKCCINHLALWSGFLFLNPSVSHRHLSFLKSSLNITMVQVSCLFTCHNSYFQISKPKFDSLYSWEELWDFFLKNLYKCGGESCVENWAASYKQCSSSNTAKSTYRCATLRQHRFNTSQILITWNNKNGIKDWRSRILIIGKKVTVRIKLILIKGKSWLIYKDNAGKSGTDV